MKTKLPNPFANHGRAEEREARSLAQFRDMMKKNPGVFTTSLRAALASAVVRIAAPGRNPTKFERQFMATARFGLERGFGESRSAHELHPIRPTLRPA